MASPLQSLYESLMNHESDKRDPLKKKKSKIIDYFSILLVTFYKQHSPQEIC